MTKEELRVHPGYIEALNKIINYSDGFKFTVEFHKIPIAKANALRILLDDCCRKGLIECVSILNGWDENGVFTELKRTYRRRVHL